MYYKLVKKTCEYTGETFSDNVAQEGIEKITPTVANAAGSIAQSISKGIQEGKKEADNK